MSRSSRVPLALLAVLLAAAPLSVVLTLVLLPLWSWVESSMEIESVGHSGPAEWCYVFVFVVLVVCGALAVLVGLRRRKSSGGPV